MPPRGVNGRVQKTTPADAPVRNGQGLARRISSPSMYLSFFELQQEPFSIAPDPRFLYMSDKHGEALALLNYGLNRGASFVLLTGEIGAGKTTVWRRFLEELPSNFDVASVVNPKLDAQALVAR